MFWRLFFVTNTPTPAPSNPADYLRSSGGGGTFSSLKSTLEGVLADAYGTLMAIGFGLIGCTLVAAFIMFGVLKETTAVKENKQWILRLLLAVIGIACAITFIGIAAAVGNSIE